MNKRNRDAFYDDVTLDGEKVDNKLRVMFAINQYNEGIHAPNIDGVIMGRGTTSDIVYFEQLGRALAVRGNTKEMFDELEKHSLEELLEMCQSRDIPVKENATKEDLIEKLIAPVVIDLTNNYDFIKELENNLKDRIRDIQENGLGNHRDVKIRDASFDIEIENQDLFEMLRYVSDRLTKTWEDYYELAKAYYEHYHNLEVPFWFKTNDGYTKDDNGVIRLGRWVNHQRDTIPKESERGQLLSQIGMRFEKKKRFISWEDMYEYAKVYYEHYHDLEVPQKFETNDGYTRVAKGKVNLGGWIAGQRKNTSPESKHGQLLSKIGMRFDNKVDIIPWEDMYEYAKIYYEHHHDLEVPQGFETNDGYTRVAKGKIKLGRWLAGQRKNTSPESKRGQLLSKIGLKFSNQFVEKWNKMYEYAKAYYEHHHNLEVPGIFRTNDGYTHDENGLINLGTWIIRQRAVVLPESERGQLLSKIGMSFEKKRRIISWEEMYEYAKVYYEHHHDLEVPQEFETNDGYRRVAKGKIDLGGWIYRQRAEISPESKRGQLLSQIGMRFENKVHILPWEEMYEYAKIYYEHYHNLDVPAGFKTNDGYTKDDNGKYNLGGWVARQRRLKPLESEQWILLSRLGMVWNIYKNKEEINNICRQYNIDIIKNKDILKHISVQELESKIEFLKSHNIPIVDEQGLLIDIFSMSSPDMKVKYGLSLEEIINEYYIKNQMGKGV